MVSQLCNNSITKNTEICPVWISHFKDSYFFFVILYMITVILGSWKRVPGPLEPELQVAVSSFHGCWESISGPWKKGVHALKYWAISSAQYSHFKNEIIGKFIKEVAQLGIKGKRLVWKYGGGGWRELGWTAQQRNWLRVTGWKHQTSKQDFECCPHKETISERWQVRGLTQPEQLMESLCSHATSLPSYYYMTPNPLPSLKQRL